MSRRTSLIAVMSSHAILIVTSAFVLIPFIWMISLSVKAPGEIFRASFSIFPEQWYAAENYSRAWNGTRLPRFMFNGFIVCTAIVTLQIAVCAPAAYALAKLRFKGRDA